MIPLCLHDCEIKISFYKHELLKAKQALDYLKQPDKESEKRISKEIKQYTLKARSAPSEEKRQLYFDLARYAKEELRYLPQHLKDDELAAVKAQRREQTKRYKGKLDEAIDEMEALQCTPELFDEIRAQYADLPPGVRGNPYMVLDNGTVVTDTADVVTAQDIQIGRA